nr:histidine kinase [uncultured Draconibacterium sp.]
MTDRLQHIVDKIIRMKNIRIIYHALFWIVVVLFYFFVFSWNSAFRAATIIFSAGLLPVAILLTYFINYFLVPRFLWEKRYGLFFLFSLYTLLTGVWLSFLIVFYALLYILKNKATIDPSVLHPELQVISLNFIVFFAIAVKQVKRAFFIQQEKNELERKKLKTELKLKEAELKLLKAQIHPHFLFNTLNNLYGLTMEKSDEAPGLVLRLSEILDYILYRCNEKRVLLFDEIANLQNYIEIEKLRYSQKLSIDIDFPEETNNLQIAPLLLLPFVENAFKHGVSQNPGVARITASLKTRHTSMEFRIENSINPAKTLQNNHSKGIGLQNVKKRLELLYPQKYKLEIDEKEATFSVTLSLQLAE